MEQSISELLAKAVLNESPIVFRGYLRLTRDCAPQYQPPEEIRTTAQRSVRLPKSVPTAGLPVTVNDFVEEVAARLPQASFEYVTSGSEDEVTLRDNVEAFRRIRVLPPLLHGVNKTDLSTTVLGQKISMPILLAPVAALRMLHPHGVLASARAAARANTIYAASSSALNSVEEIAPAADGPKWFQVYVSKQRAVAKNLSYGPKRPASRRLW